MTNKRYDPLSEVNFPVKRIVYELFISLVTVLALGIILGYYLLDISPPVTEVLLITDSIMGLVLLIDFFIRLAIAPRKLKYLLPFGLLDFFSGLPALPFLRLLRLPRLVLTIYILRRRVSRELIQVARMRLAESTLLLVALVALFVITAGSAFVVFVESGAPGANIETGEEAVWWAFVTTATVGYGDYYPVTSAGRIGGVVLMLVGISIFSALTSYIASSVLAARRRDQGDLNSIRAELAELKQMIAQSSAGDASQSSRAIEHKQPAVGERPSTAEGSH